MKMIKMKMIFPQGLKIHGLLYEVATEDKDFNDNFVEQIDSDPVEMMIDAR